MDGFSSRTRGQVESTAPSRGGNATLVAIGIVAALYFGRDVFIPAAAAILLSFVLAIPVRILTGWGLGRRLPVAIVVLFAFATILGIGAVVTTQVTQLAGDLPRYQSTIRDKIASFREAATGRGPVERVAEMLQELSNEFSTPVRPKPAGPAEADKPAPPKPVPVEVVGESRSPVASAQAFLGPLVHPIATIGLVAILVVFILMQRNDLRNRLIRLAGSHDLQRTTAAMNDAAGRLSRFFLIQVLLNAGFGIIVGLGLWLIGTPSPVLWGIVAAISRFIPYVGVVLAAGFPIVLSAAVDPNWGMLLQTIAFFAIIEFVVGQVIEPLLYGHSTGLSPVAVIASVTFWTWLWGGVGLLLATPLTVCLVVLGRHVKPLEFLEVMFGDRPPLTAAEIFYQRMLAGDADEGLEQAEALLAQHSLAAYYDEIALKGLALAQHDANRGALDAKRSARVAETIEQLIEEIGDSDVAILSEPKSAGERADGDAELEARLVEADRRVAGLPAPVDGAAPASAPVVLCVGGRNALDRACGAMLAQLLGRHGIAARVEGHEFLAGGPPVASQEADEPKLVVLSVLDASSPVQIRYAVRRLRRRMPGARILVGAWGLDEDASGSLCEAARSDGCASRLGEALRVCLERIGESASAPARDAA